MQRFLTDLTRPQRAAAASCILMGLCAYFYSPHSPSAAWGDLFLLAGGAAFWLALRWRGAAWADESRPEAPLPGRTSGYTRFDAALTAAGAACLWLMAEGSSALLSRLFGSDGLFPMHVHVQFGLFCAGILLVAAGLSGLRKPAFNPRETAVLAAITLMGFGFRAWNLENSVHMFVDEMHFANAVADLWDDARTALLTPMNQISAFSWLYAYMQTHTVAVFGPTLTGLRAVSVIFGALTIPAVYLLAKALFDRKTALLAALLLATFPPHIHFSRLGLNNIADPLFGTLALAFLARGLRDGGNGGARADFALAGVCLGLTQCFYEGGKLVFPLVAAAWLGMEFLARRRTGAPARLNGRSVFILLVAALITAAPLYYVLVGWRSAYAPRLAVMRLETAYWVNLLAGRDGAGQMRQYVRDQLNPALYHYVQHPDGGAFYYGGHTALILPYLVPAFFFGVVALLRRRSPGDVSLLLIVLLTALGNSLLTFPDWTARFVVTFPALAVIMAAGVRALWAFWPPPADEPSRNLPQKTVRRRPALLAVTLPALALIQVVYYFGPHLALYNRQIRPFRDHQDVGWRARDFPPGTQVYLFTDELTFLPHIEGMERYWRVEIEATFIHPHWFMIRGAGHLPRGVDLAFFVKLEDRELIRYLDRVFDLPPPRFSPYNVPEDRQYALFYVDHE